MRSGRRLPHAPALVVAGLCLLCAACKVDGTLPAIGSSDGAEAPAGRQLAEAHLNLGKGLEAAGDIDGAVEDYAAALAADPWATGAGASAGDTPIGPLERICSGGKPAQAAARACTVVITSLRYPVERLPEFLTRRGEANARLGDDARALTDVQSALRIDSSYPDALMVRARLREAAGQRGGAFADYNLALIRKPDWPPALYGRARMRAAAGNDQGAVEDFDRLLSDPAAIVAFPDAYRDRALVHCRLGRADAAAIGWQTWMASVPGGKSYVEEMLWARGYLRAAPGPEFGPVEIAALRAWTRDSCPNS